MLGRNPTLKAQHDGGQSLVVQSVFSTMQGEGPHAGLPATFIRLWGCHLKCWFCDTDFTSNEQQRDIDDLLDRCSEMQNSLIVLTGGEPMRQNIAPLCEELLSRGKHVQIETAGNFWFPSFEVVRAKTIEENERFSIVVSPKGPAVHRRIAARAEAWKYIVGAGDALTDDRGLPFVNFQEHGGTPHALAVPPDFDAFDRRRVYIQPRDDLDATANNRNLAFALNVVRKYGYRLSLQQHKIVGLE